MSFFQRVINVQVYTLLHFYDHSTEVLNQIPVFTNISSQKFSICTVMNRTC